MTHSRLIFRFDEGNQHLLSGDRNWITDLDDDSDFGIVYLTDHMFDFLNFDPYAPELRLFQNVSLNDLTFVPRARQRGLELSSTYPSIFATYHLKVAFFRLTAKIPSLVKARRLSV